MVFVYLGSGGCVFGFEVLVLLVGMVGGGDVWVFVSEGVVFVMFFVLVFVGLWGEVVFEEGDDEVLEEVFESVFVDFEEDSGDFMDLVDLDVDLDLELN